MQGQDIVTRTKKALQDCASEFDTKAAKNEESTKWANLFQKYSTMESEEEWESCTTNWEDCEFVTCYDAKLDQILLTDCDKDDSGLQIVDINDKKEVQDDPTNGGNLAQYIKGFSEKVKSGLNNRKPKIHIKGSMLGTLQNGSFSNVQKTMRLRIMGLDLEFSKEYLDCIKSMTGHDLRKKAFEVSIIANAAGSTSTIQEISEENTVSHLSDQTLVNQSVTSELNISIRNQKLFSFFTPKANRTKESLRAGISKLSLSRSGRDKSNINHKTGSILNISIDDQKPSSSSSSYLNQRPSSSPSSGYKPALNISVNQSVIDDERLNQSWSRHKALKSAFTAQKARSEIKQDSFLSSTVTPGSLKRTSRSHLNLSRMFTPLKAEPDKPKYGSHSDSASLRKQCFSKLDEVTHKSQPDLLTCGMSPMKRYLEWDDQQSSPKRAKNHDQSMLSSTRIEETSGYVSAGYSRATSSKTNLFDNNSISNGSRDIFELKALQLQKLRRLYQNNNNNGYVKKRACKAEIIDELIKEPGYQTEEITEIKVKKIACKGKERIKKEKQPQHNNQLALQPKFKHEQLAIKKENSIMEVPLVTELLRGLNRSDRRLRVTVNYDIKLDEGDDD